MSQEMRQIVRSPEQVELLLPVAGPTSRILAFAVDWSVMFALQIAIWIGVLFALPVLFRLITGPIERLIRERALPTSSDPFLLLVAVVWMLQLGLEVGYFLFMESATGGQSLGKRWLGLRVVRDGGFPITFRHSLVRNLLRAVDALPGSYLVGLVAVIVSDEGKRLGDVAAGTLVVRLDRPPPPLPLPDLPPAAQAFAFDRAQVARIGETEVTLALEALRRIDSLDPAHAAEVLARAVHALCARMEYPPVAPHERTAFLHAVLSAVGLG
jgi:uncharacterized RDD family membrane protein YckC